MDAINIFNVKVNGLEYGASVGIGPVLQVGVQTASKHYIMNGTVSGDGTCMPTLMTVVNDPDVIDTPGWIYSPAP